MLRWLPALIVVASAAVIAFGMGREVTSTLGPAPFVHGDDGRAHPHTERITRLPGSPGDVRDAVVRATGRDPVASDWKDRIREIVDAPEDATHVVVLPRDGDDALAWALPGAWWAAATGAHVTFAGRELISGDIVDLLREKELPVYVMAPRSHIGATAMSDLHSLGNAQRIAAPTLAGHAVRVASWRDRFTGIGPGEEGLPEVALVAPAEAEAALEALALAHRTGVSLLYADDDGGLPAGTDRYLWSRSAPDARGGIRRAWVLGSRPTYATQARVDLALSGDAAPRPAGLLTLGATGLGLAGAALVLVLAGGRRDPTVLSGWTATATLLPVVGPALWALASRSRGVLAATITATVVAFGHGAPLLVALSWTSIGAGRGGGPLVGAVGAVALPYLLSVATTAAVVRVALRPVGRAREALSVGVALATLTPLAVGLVLLEARVGATAPPPDALSWFGAAWVTALVALAVGALANGALLAVTLRRQP